MASWHFDDLKDFPNLNVKDKIQQVLGFLKHQLMRTNSPYQKATHYGKRVMIIPDLFLVLAWLQLIFSPWYTKLILFVPGVIAVLNWGIGWVLESVVTVVGVIVMTPAQIHWLVTRNHRPDTNPSAPERPISEAKWHIDYTYPSEAAPGDAVM